MHRDFVSIEVVTIFGTALKIDNKLKYQIKDQEKKRY
jgi:hypothetical protein